MTLTLVNRTVPSIFLKLKVDNWRECIAMVSTFFRREIIVTSNERGSSKSRRVGSPVSTEGAPSKVTTLDAKPAGPRRDRKYLINHSAEMTNRKVLSHDRGRRGRAVGHHVRHTPRAITVNGRSDPNSKNRASSRAVSRPTWNATVV